MKKYLMMARTFSLIPRALIVIAIVVVADVGISEQIAALEAKRPSSACSPGSRPAAERLAAFDVPATGPEGVQGPRLDAGASYDVVVKGTFAFSQRGSRSDGRDLWVGEQRVRTIQRSQDHVYCLRVRGDGTAAKFLVRDVSYADNSGSLAVEIYKGRD